MRKKVRCSKCWQVFSAIRAFSITMVESEDTTVRRTICDGCMIKAVKEAFAGDHIRNLQKNKSENGLIFCKS